LHAIEQVPLPHDGVPFVLLHGWPQPPQWATVVFVFVSHLLLGRPSQLPNPLLQFGTQAPEVHCVVPFGLMHCVPHTPQ